MDTEQISPEEAPFIDLVQIRTEGSFGSGLLVGPGLVLTALHCVCQLDENCVPRKTIGVYLFRTLKIQQEEVHLKAEIVWPNLDEIRNNSPDVALLRIIADVLPTPLSKIQFGELPDVPTVGVARGFPPFVSGTQLPGEREEYEQPGRVTYTSLTRRQLTIDQVGVHENYGADRWRGISGGPLIVNKLVVGIMRDVPRGWRGEALTAEPLAPLLRSKSAQLLRDLLGVQLPLESSSDPIQSSFSKAYSVIGIEAYASSQRTFNLVTEKPIFGRSADLELLTNSLSLKDRGFILVSGEAGIGKSRLVSALINQLQGRTGTVVLQHAFSTREVASSTRNAMVASLVRQAADSLGPEALGSGEPGDSSRLSDRLAHLIASDRPERFQLILVIDALDEAADPILPTPVTLGRGVYIVITCRASSDDEPRILRSWREQAIESNNLLIHHNLPPLNVAGITEWLSSVSGKEFEITNQIVDKALQASEGIPLFASYLIPDAIEFFYSSPDNSFPPNFENYALQSLTDIRDRIVTTPASYWSWSEIVHLFAILSIAKAPLSTAALFNLVSKRQLDELDQRAERWLWRRSDKKANIVSIAHPRLAMVFRKTLNKFIPNIIYESETQLIDACSQELHVQSSSKLQEYAIDWLPSHLIGFGRFKEAADLLGDISYLIARLSANRKTISSAVRSIASETIMLDPHIEGSQLVFRWRRFWAESEIRVLEAIERGEVLNFGAEEIFSQIARDRLGDDLSKLKQEESVYVLTSSLLRLRYPCGFHHDQALLRSIDNAHVGAVIGVIEAYDGLVSWDDVGSIHLWSFSGEPKIGQASAAHKGGVRGVRVVPHGFVSWGNDGAIRRWTRDGRRLKSGSDSAHKGPVDGLLVLPNGFVSWSQTDGSMRFWTFNGEPLEGGVPDNRLGHTSGVWVSKNGLMSCHTNGAVYFWTLDGHLRRCGIAGGARNDIKIGGMCTGEQFVTWSSRELLRFWTSKGEQLPDRGSLSNNRIDYCYAGMLALPDGFVTWSDRGTLRFWTIDGEVRPGSELILVIDVPLLFGWRKRTESVIGALPLKDSIVTWTREGAIRFWTHHGVLLPGGSLEAHLDSEIRGVAELSDRLVSWGGDGAIRYWSFEGRPISEGFSDAHRTQIAKYDLQGVVGVLPLQDKLVSWGGDGAIRFWSYWPKGDTTEKICRQVHKGKITALIKTPEGFVSGGEDGVICFWSENGSIQYAGREIIHWGGVSGLLLLSNVVVSWGNEGGIWFWKLNGRRMYGDEKAHYFESDFLFGGRTVGDLKLFLLPDRLVSRGDSFGYDETSVRFWRIVGSGVKRGVPDERAKELQGIKKLFARIKRWYSPDENLMKHWKSIEGVLAIKDGLVCWTRCEIRICDSSGTPRDHRRWNAHSGGIGGIILHHNKLVTWGNDCAICFWTLEGAALSGGNPKAHAGGVNGVVALPNHLVSWGADGAIRFWSFDGVHQDGGDLQAHSGQVRGVLALSDRIVSWGGDNIIRQWTLEGEKMHGTWFAPTTIDSVIIAEKGLCIGMAGRIHMLDLQSIKSVPHI